LFVDDMKGENLLVGVKIKVSSMERYVLGLFLLKGKYNGVYIT